MQNRNKLSRMPQARSPKPELVDMPKNEEEEERTLSVLLPLPLLLPPCNVSVYVPKCKCVYVSRLCI